MLVVMKDGEFLTHENKFSQFITEAKSFTSWSEAENAIASFGGEIVEYL